MLDIYVDADACPVKEEIYRVAARYGLGVIVVANSRLRVPEQPGLHLEVVPGSFDAADDWIASHAGPGDLVVTADIPLAARCIAAGARVLGHTGRAFTEDNIGDVLATRDLLSDLREGENVMGGPPPFQKKDRSRFLQKLDELVNSLRREQGAG